MTFDYTDDSNISSLNIYPNPSRGKLYIEFDIFENDDFKISIIDAVGNAILIEEKQSYNGDYFKVFQLNNYKKGIYIIRVENSKSIITRRIVLQ